MTNREAEKVLSLPPEDSNNGVEMSESEEPQETSSSLARCEPVSCDPEAPQMNGEAAEEAPSQEPCDNQEDTADMGNNLTLGKPKRKKRGRPS
ncbi:nuclear body protein SP140 [Heterocephalus glaber]|uniref:Nuclear body protein SP140 n=1 Tax=Heterocephalus glaber TaxID=10181 RepID=A0AAX6S409_HETGA|nr:nuclear body protein SP140 [Heterocephalus glaber]